MDFVGLVLFGVFDLLVVGMEGVEIYCVVFVRLNRC